MRYVFMLLWIGVLIFGIAFASLNAHEVFINIFVTTVHIFLPLLLLTVLVIGSLCGILATSTMLLKGKYENRKLRKHLHKVEKELHALQKSHDQDKKMVEL